MPRASAGRMTKSRQRSRYFPEQMTHARATPIYPSHSGREDLAQAGVDHRERDETSNTPPVRACHNSSSARGRSQIAPSTRIQLAFEARHGKPCCNQLGLEI